MAIHIAIVYKSYLQQVIAGAKIVEGRFTKVRCAPYRRIKEGDVVFFKEPSGPVIARAIVERVLFFDITSPKQAQEIIERFRELLCLREDFIPRALEARYATLIYLNNIMQIEPITISKKDRRGWIILPRQLSFLQYSKWESELLSLAGEMF